MSERLPLIVTPWFTAANEPPLTVTFLSKVPPNAARLPPTDVLPWISAPNTRQSGAPAGTGKVLATVLLMTSVVGGSSYVTPGDRESTRLNSSHSQISYAGFC